MSVKNITDIDIKMIKYPRFTKFAVLVCVLVSLVIILINFRNYSNVWDNQFVSKYFNGVIKNDDLTSENFLKITWIQKALEASEKFHPTLYHNDATNNATNNGTSVILFNAEDVVTCFRRNKLHRLSMSDSTTGPKSPGDNNDFHFYMLSKFGELLQSVQVKAAIIEPSILFCTLQAERRKLLRKRHFNIANFTGSKYIITYGITEDSVSSLEQEENRRKFREAGFQSYFVQMPLQPWMENDTRYTSEKLTSHIFYMYYKWTVHVVVLYKRSSYLWHASLDANEDMFNIPQKNGLLFVDNDSAYENFDFKPLATKNNSVSSIYVPSSSEYFLFQISSSRFLECNYSRAVHVKSDEDSTKVSSSSLEDFEKNTLGALQELKKLFNPLLMNFWIFSGTMLGWYRQCGIIPYTSDVDFAAWISEVDDLDYLINYFRGNKTLYIKERMGLQEEALEFQLRINNLRVDVFFAYKIENGSWCSGHRPGKGYYFRYYYPPYTICSAELLRQKVQVPCETEDVIRTEYGPGWPHPESYWYYESSIKNRGPNIYWDEKRRPIAFQEY